MKKDERGIFSLGVYQPYWLYNYGDKIRNPEFNNHTGGYILDVKNNKYVGIEHYTNILKAIIQNDDVIKCNPILTCVPSSKKGKIGEGLERIIDNICRECQLDNFCGYLHRDFDIPKLSSGGNRNIDVHLNSISVSNKSEFKGRSVIILDDVTTTGNSLKACEKLLNECGATGIALIALGKTVSHY